MRAVGTSVLAAVMCMAVVSSAGCKGPPIEMQVNALGFADPATHPTYFLAPGNEGVTEDDLEFREFAVYAERALADRGFRRTDDIEAASAVLLFAYGVSDPKTFTQQSAVPVWGQTGYSSARTTGMATSYGPTTLYSGRTTYTPTYGVVGSQTVTRTIVFFVRHASLSAFDAQTARESGTARPLWTTSIASSGDSGDLRLAMPALLAGAQPYLAANSGQAVRVKIRLSNARVTRLKSGPAAIAPKTAAP